MHYFVSMTTNVGPIHFPVYVGRDVDIPAAVETEGKQRGVFFDVASVSATEITAEEYREILS